MKNKLKANEYLSKPCMILAIVHFCLSFVYERFVFKFNADSWDIFWSISKDDRFSNIFQSTVLYIYSKLIAAILIFLLWFVIGLIVKNKIPKHILISAVIVLVVGGIYLYVFWPSSSAWKDTFTLYGFAIRLIPWYWHHFLTSAWYAGCLMVFPHPLIIAAVQFAIFIAVIFYLIYRIETSFNTPKWVGYLVFLICLAPETLWLVAFPYRNCIYALIFMFYVVFIVFEGIDKGKITPFKILVIGFLSAFLSAWRTEGIFVGIIGMVLALFAIYKTDLGKKIALIVTFAACFVILNAPQKIGGVKYYGKDYLIASTVEPIHYILNDEGANLTYEGAEADMEAIADFAPLIYFKCDGKNSLNAYFYQKGHIDFDQSLASDEVQSKYLKAFFRIVLHNVPTYVKQQLNMTFESLGIKYSFELEEYLGEMPDISYEYAVDQIGELDFMRLAKPITNNAIYKAIGGIVAPITISYRQFMAESGIMATVRIIILVLNFAIFIFEFVKIFRRKSTCDTKYLLLSLLFLVQLGIVVMTIPMVLDKYFYSIIYPCFTMECIWGLDMLTKKRRGENDA